MISNVEDITWTRDRAEAIHSFGFSRTRPDGSLFNYKVYDIFYPDGTGMFVGGTPLGFESSDSPIFFTAAFCWELDSEGRIIFEDFFGIPTAEDCANGGSPDGNRLTFELYDEFNNQEDLLVTFGPNDGSGDLFVINPEKAVREESFTATPPFLEFDFAAGTPNSPISVNVIANDQTRDFPIDLSTIEITGGPINLSTRADANGSLAVDTTTGVLTYTPDASDTSSRRIWVNYQLRDNNGNLAAPTIAEFFIDPANTGSGDDTELARTKSVEKRISLADRFEHLQTN